MKKKSQVSYIEEIFKIKREKFYLNYKIVLLDKNIDLVELFYMHITKLAKLLYESNSLLIYKRYLIIVIQKLTSHYYFRYFFLDINVIINI